MGCLQARTAIAIACCGCRMVRPSRAICASGIMGSVDTAGRAAVGLQLRVMTSPFRLVPAVAVACGVQVHALRPRGQHSSSIPEWRASATAAGPIRRPDRLPRWQPIHAEWGSSIRRTHRVGRVRCTTCSALWRPYRGVRWSYWGLWWCNWCRPQGCCSYQAEGLQHCGAAAAPAHHTEAAGQADVVRA